MVGRIVAAASSCGTLLPELTETHSWGNELTEGLAAAAVATVRRL